MDGTGEEIFIDDLWDGDRQSQDDKEVYQSGRPVNFLCIEGQEARQGEEKVDSLSQNLPYDLFKEISQGTDTDQKQPTLLQNSPSHRHTTTSPRDASTPPQLPNGASEAGWWNLPTGGLGQVQVPPVQGKISSKVFAVSHDLTSHYKPLPTQLTTFRCINW